MEVMSFVANKVEMLSLIANEKPMMSLNTNNGPNMVRHEIVCDYKSRTCLSMKALLFESKRIHCPLNGVNDEFDLCNHSLNRKATIHIALKQILLH